MVVVLVVLVLVLVPLVVVAVVVVVHGGRFSLSRLLLDDVYMVGGGFRKSTI